MTPDPYANLRAVVKAAGRPKAAATNVGQALLHSLLADGVSAVQFEAKAGAVKHLRDSAKRAMPKLAPGCTVSIYRLDPNGPGGAGRVSTWEAVLVRPAKEARLAA